MSSVRPKSKGGSGKDTSGGFQSMQLPQPVFQGIMRLGFKQPTPVQRKTLPVALLGVDLVTMARTGSGKTAAFVIPILAKLLEHSSSGCRCVILSPTRDLALQTLKVIQAMAKFTDLRAIPIVGGDGMEAQFSDLSARPDIIVATPGRLAHHLLEIPDFNLNNCEMVVYDEADRLFEMGFAQQLRDITRGMPSNKQSMLFSATMPKMLVEFARAGLNDPTLIRLDSEANVSDQLRISFLTTRSTDKDAVLLYLLREVLPSTSTNTARETDNKKSSPLTIVFAATRHHVDYLSALLNATNLPCVPIYGAMDPLARKANLHAFRSGKIPILVVTDVAARGLDVPLIDHVIHHSFPPDPKLYIHRSGRAARAGRVGYAFALVEPDEMPFMVDLHLFLARRPTTCDGVFGGEPHVNGRLKYTLDEMTPEDVHFGSVPEGVITDEVENVRRILENETGNLNNDNMPSLAKTAANAIKQYRRSRPEPSREGVRRSKDILRLTNGAPPHPILLSLEDGKMETLRSTAAEKAASKTKANVASVDDIQARNDFLLAMSSFRPKETIFEAKASAGGSNNMGAVDRTRNIGTVKGDSKQIMKSMRREMTINRSKSSLVIAGSQTAHTLNGDEVVDVKKGAEDEVDMELFDGSGQDENDDDENDDDENDDDGAVTSFSAAFPSSSTASASTTTASLTEPAGERRHLSKKERKLLKAGKSLASVVGSSERAKKSAPPNSYKSADYIEYDQSQGFTQRDRDVEAALQPSSGTGNTRKSSALELLNAQLDIVGDEKQDLINKQRVMRWDKQKRKYIQTTLGDEAAGMTHAKKVRLESGAMLEGKKKKERKLGDLYEKWQQKTNKSIGRQGVFDDIQMGEDAEKAAADAESGDGGGVGREKKAERTPGGKKINPRWQTKEKLEQKAMNKKNNAEEIKNLNQIKKKREYDANMKIKNMKKADRTSYMKHQKEKEKERGAGGKGGGKDVPAKKGSFVGGKGSKGKFKK